MNDHQLIEGCKDGDPRAQRKLYELHHPKMLGVCIRYAPNRDEAQDILQEAFIKVFKSIKSFKGKGSLEGWIRKVVVNTALEHYRKNKQQRMETDIEHESLMVVSRDNAQDELQMEDLLQFIQNLPSGYRMVFNLFAIEGYSHEEIAKQLKISINTSYSQYHRARALLQKVLLSEKTSVKRAI